MRVREFTYGTDSDTGMEGLKANWMPNAEPGNGRLCAHDVLEHDTGEPGAAEGEMMAVGTSLYIRGFSGWFHHTSQSVEEIYANDVSSILERVAEGTESLADPGATRALRDGDAEERSFQELIERGFNRARDELPHRMEDWQEIAAEVLTAENKRRALGWLRKGYRRAIRRYAGVDPYEVGRMFTELAKEIDRKIPDLCDGDRVTVRINAKTLRFSVETPYDRY